MRTAISSRLAQVVLLAALSAAGLLVVGISTLAGEPIQGGEQTASVRDRLDRVSTLVERLSERVKAQRAALEAAEADLELARELADELAELAKQEWKAAIQKQYEADKRRTANERADEPARDEPSFRIIPLAR